jgi:hypothetical protein
MKFDPDTKELFTDTGTLIKVLHCPLRKRWEQLNEAASSPHRTCSECEREVLDTAAMSESEVLSALRADPSTCLCVSACQENVTILPARQAEPNAAADGGRDPGSL